MNHKYSEKCSTFPLCGFQVSKVLIQKTSIRHQKTRLCEHCSTYRVGCCLILQSSNPNGRMSTVLVCKVTQINADLSKCSSSTFLCHSLFQCDAKVLIVEPIPTFKESTGEVQSLLQMLLRPSLTSTHCVVPDLLLLPNNSGK